MQGWPPAWLFRLGTAILAPVFLARAVGDFRYVGFFKSVRGTPFATMDSWCYAPLCLFLAALALRVTVG